MSSIFFFFFKQKTAYELRISDWSSDVCSSDLPSVAGLPPRSPARPVESLARPDRRREPWRRACAESIGERADRVVFVDIHARCLVPGQRDDRGGNAASRNRAVAAEGAVEPRGGERSEEHTSEPQSLMRN